MAFSSARQLCNFSGAFTIYRVKKPLEVSQSVSACIWANLWVLLSPQPQTGPSFFSTWTTVVGTLTTTSPPPPSFWFHSHLWDPCIPSCSLLSHNQESKKEEFHQVCNIFAWLRPRWGFIPVAFSLASVGGTAAVAAGGGGKSGCQRRAAGRGFSNMGH